MSEGLSVVVVTYNRPELLARVCGRLRSQRGCEVEVIVVDDGSEPPADARDLGCAHYLWRPDDGFRKVWGLNQGVRMASFERVAFLDDDTVPEKDCWALRHLEVLEEFEVVRGPYALALSDGDRLRSASPTMYGTRRHYYASTNTSMAVPLF